MSYTERVPDFVLERTKMVKGRCMATGCLKTAINGRRYCQLHADPGRAGLARERKAAAKIRREFLSALETYIYAVRCNEFFKFGKADRPVSRLNSMQTGSPYELTLVGTVREKPVLEKEIHEYLREDRFRGEWFLNTDRVVEIVTMISEKRVTDLLRLVRI